MNINSVRGNSDPSAVSAIKNLFHFLFTSENIDKALKVAPTAMEVGKIAATTNAAVTANALSTAAAVATASSPAAAGSAVVAGAASVAGAYAAAIGALFHIGPPGWAILGFLALKTLYKACKG